MEVLARMAFSHKFRKMVGMLFTNAFAEVLINGEVGGMFALRRSVR